MDQSWLAMRTIIQSIFRSVGRCEGRWRRDAASPAPESPSVEAARLFPAQYRGAALRLLSLAAVLRSSRLRRILVARGDHDAPADRWKFALHLIALDGAAFRDHVFEDSPQRRNVPLSIAQLVELSALRVPRPRRRKSGKRSDSPQLRADLDRAP